jgi:hypothetical protein
LDNSPAHSDGYRLRPVVSAQFLHNVLDVDFDGLLGNQELLGDIPVAVTAGDLLQDLRYHEHVRLIIDDGTDSLAQQGMIVDTENANTNLVASLVL